MKMLPISPLPIKWDILPIQEHSEYSPNSKTIVSDQAESPQNAAPQIPRTQRFFLPDSHLQETGLQTIPPDV
jgi:hypothetical protein